MNLDEIQEYLENKANAIIQKFLGKPCNYCYAKLLEVTLNNMYLNVATTNLISPDSRVSFKFGQSNFAEKLLVYSANIFVPNGTETVTISTTYTAILGE